MKDKEVLIEGSGPAFDGPNPLIYRFTFVSGYACTPNGDGHNDKITPFGFFNLDSASVTYLGPHTIDVGTQIFYNGKLVYDNKQTATVTSDGYIGRLQYSDYVNLSLDGSDEPEGVYQWVRKYDFFEGSQLKITGYTCSMKGECLEGSSSCLKWIRFLNGFYSNPGSPDGLSYDPASTGEVSCN